MHPLAVFPQLLTYGLIAPFVLRVVSGLFVAEIGKEGHNKHLSWASIIYLALGTLLVLGLYTQVVSILSIVAISANYFLEKGQTTFPKEKKVLYIVIKIILLSLLFTGPGFLAFDLPL
ncbi:MAG TPA: hypothetical protein VJC13_00745 [Candidatus Paceibacterota bacterium]